MSFKGSKDVDFSLVSEKLLSRNNGPMGWGPGPGKGSQKHPHLWRSPALMRKGYASRLLAARRDRVG